jgi:hypothetical protein
MNKSIVLVLLFNIFLGVVALSIDVLNNRSLEEAFVLVNLEKDVEMDRVSTNLRPLDLNIFVFNLR